MKKALRAAALLLALGMLLSGCSGGSTAASETDTVSDSSASSAAAEPSAPSGTEHLIIGYEPESGFNPYIANSSLVLQNCSLLFEKLVEIDPDMQLDYRVAESVETGGTTAYIHLRGGLCFSDGTSITAEDMAASLEAARRSSCYGARFSNVASVEVQGDALVVTLNKPDSLFAYLLDIPVLKAAEVGEKLPTADGPYTYGTESHRLVRNSRDLLASDGPSEIELYEVDGYDDMVRDLSMGDLNLYTAGEAATVNASQMSQETHFKTNNLIFIGVNSQSESILCSDARGRSLLSRLLDRRTLAEKSYYGRAYPATGVINCYYSCVQSQQTTDSTQNTEKLFTTMTSLGFTVDGATGYYTRETEGEDGEKGEDVPTLLVYAGSAYKKNAAAQIQAQLAEQGIRVRLQEENDFETYRSMVVAGDFDLYIGEVKLYNNMDLDCFFEGGTLSAYLAQDENLYNSYLVFEQNKSSAGDFEAAFAAYSPLIPLLWRYGTVVTSRGVQGLSSSVSNVFYSLKDLSFTG